MAIDKQETVKRLVALSAALTELRDLPQMRPHIVHVDVAIHLLQADTCLALLTDVVTDQQQQIQDMQRQIDELVGFR